MKFMSNTAVFIVIAAFAACAASADGSLQRRLGGCSCGPYGCSCTLKREDLAILETAAAANEDGDSLQRRLRGCSCGIFGCSCTFKREDLAVLEAVTGVNEDAAPAGDNGESADEEQSGDSLQRRLRGCSCGIFGCSCTFKREDLAVLEAATGGNEDDASLQRRLRGCSCGPYGCSCTLKREDLPILEAATSVNGDGASLQRRRRDCSCGLFGCKCTDVVSSSTSASTEGEQQGPRLCSTASCGPLGCKTTVAPCRMKREDAIMGAYVDANEDTMPMRARRSSNCQWQCVCTTGSGGGFAIPSSLYRTRRSFTVTNGRCGLSSWFGRAKCESVQRCH